MGFRKLFYCGLESYESRYTLQLQHWSEAVFKRRGIDYVVVPGDLLDNSKAIVTGQVLDAHGRSYFSMSQMMNLVKMMKQGEVTGEDVIFFEDMFSPGIESLPYIMNQIPENMRPKVFVRCLAQTIDPDDFVHVWDMYPWMSKYEHMVNDFATVLATDEEMVAHMKIAGWTAPVYNISGLAFSKEEVISRLPMWKGWNDRKKRVVFAARFDREKSPNFYMDLIDRVKILDPEIEFAVLSGGPLRSNENEHLIRARQMEENGILKIYENLNKNEYYKLLHNSRVLFNCALQDWVSNTVSEADALGTNVLYPAYRSFPEVFANDHTRMYIPWSMDDAVNKLMVLIEEQSPHIGCISNWTDGTIDRCIDIMEGNGEQWNRSMNNYRKFTIDKKY